MSFDAGNYLIVGNNGPKDIYIHERANNNGKPGKILTFADAKGDANEIAKDYIERGFDPKKIIINGQLASDVFQKNDNQVVQSTKPMVQLNPIQALLYKSYQKVNPSNSLDEKVQPVLTLNPVQAAIYSAFKA